jgi:hypothetical protein
MRINLGDVIVWFDVSVRPRQKLQLSTAIHIEFTPNPGGQLRSGGHSLHA